MNPSPVGRRFFAFIGKNGGALTRLLPSQSSSKIIQGISNLLPVWEQVVLLYGTSLSGPEKIPLQSHLYEV
jgi:hypothetical protein